jgi:outer membrane protein assembly factor BamB
MKAEVRSQKLEVGATQGDGERGAQGRGRKSHRNGIQHALLIVSALLLVGSICKKPPRVPDKPTGPSMVQKGAVAAYSTKTTDASGSEVRYQFEWGDGTTSAWSEFVTQDSLFSDTHAFTHTGALRVRARAQNLKNATSGWSDTLRVNVLAGETTLKWVYAYLDENFDSVPFTGTMAASPAGYEYAVSEGGFLHAINQEGGRRSSFQTLDDAEFVCPPMIWNDLCWVASDDTVLNATRVNGTRAFALPIRGDILGSLACDGNGRIYFNCDNDSLYCYDTLGRRWAAFTGGGASSPVISANDELVVCGGADGKIHAFVTENGTESWTWTTGGPVNSSGAIASDGTIYIGSDDGSLYAMKPDGGAPLWQYPANSPVVTSPVIDAAGIIYFTSDNGVVHAVNSTTHAPVWTHSLNSDGASTGALSQNGVLFIKALYAVSDSLIALNTSDGSDRWSASLPSGTELELVCAPLIDQYGTIYVTTGTGVHAFWGQSLPATSAWPMFQHDPQRTGNAQP